MMKLRSLLLVAVAAALAAACHAAAQMAGTTPRAYTNAMKCAFPPGAGPGSAVGYVGPGNKKIEIPGTGNLVKFDRVPEEAVQVTLREVQRPDNMIAIELETTLDLQQYPAEVYVSYNDKRCSEKLERDGRNIFLLERIDDTSGLPLASERVGTIKKQDRLRARVNHNSYYIIAD